MPAQLPSIAALHAFSTTARYLSFTEAAANLRLTQAAVSLRIRTLEERLGVSLFVRGSSLQLSASGRLYLPVVLDVLRRLERGTERVRASTRRTVKASPELRLLVMQSVASLWLMPRVGSFGKKNPDINLSMVTWIGGNEHIALADLERHKIDAAIINAPKNTAWGDLKATVMVEDFAVPVCHPSLIDRPMSRKALFAKMRSQPHIHALTWPDAWQQWYASIEENYVQPESNLWLQHTGLCVQAAANGLGWAIAHGPLIAEEVATERLSAPFGKPKMTGNCYFLISSQEAAETKAVKVFKRWLTAEMARQTIESRPVMANPAR